MTLEQLQAEWRTTAEQYGKQNERDAYNYSRSIALCADALSPFIAREKADRELIRRLTDALEASSWRLGYLEVIAEARARLKESES